MNAETSLVAHSPPPRPEHKGSASPTLSGTGLVAAWVISIGIHSVVFTTMLLLVFPFSPQVEKFEPDVHAALVGPIDAQVDIPAPPNPQRHASMLADTAAIKPDSREFADVTDVTRFRRPEVTVIGIGATGRDDRDRAGVGLSLGGGRADFFGLGGATRGVRSVVYVVDRSMSMIDTFNAVREELRRSVNALDRSQKFHVIFFNDGPPVENPPQRLVNAVSAYKKQLFEFLDAIEPKGATKPEAAMRRALALEPDVVYLLSDGEDFQWSLLKRLDQWNAARRSRIHTIAYLDDRGREILETIAREHNGESRYVSLTDLP
jgi:hypothetical protein